PKERGWGWQSKGTVLGLPWIHISFRYRDGWKPVPAKGVIAVGHVSVGVIGVGQFALGLIAIGQFVLAGWALAHVGAAYSLIAQVGVYVDDGYGQVMVDASEALRPPPTEAELRAVVFTPALRPDWPVSTPQDEGLDPLLLAGLYHEAGRSEKLLGLAVVKNGQLIGEGYFNGGGPDRKNRLASVSKSWTSAMIGIALDEGAIDGLDQKMIDYFPDVADRIQDPRKHEITLRQMLEMRTGYPWEETDHRLWETFLQGSYVPLVADFPLVSDPGTQFAYSNTVTNLLGIILERATETDMRTYGDARLFGPLGVEPGEWLIDVDGYHIACGEMHLTVREAAKLGQLYLNDGVWDGDQIIPASYVEDSLARHTEYASSGGVQGAKVGRCFRNIGYGYQWWSATVGDHYVQYAAGHGGQLTVILEEYNMVIQTASDPFYLQHDGESWKHEVAAYDLVGEFITSLPPK
ncbi:MAG: serine hydrolase, partial [Armatimonadia bacterium]|nr:serine hydrolase [Armatimonadia bacterium]